MLVVIGILIALQINNWNDWRKDRIQEKILLQDLAENLDLNIQTLNLDIKFLQQVNLSSKIILDALDSRVPYNDSLNLQFHLARVTKQDLSLSNIAYQALKDRGIGIILNKELANEIKKLHEVTIPHLLSDNSQVNQYYAPFDNHVVQNFIYDSEKGLTPNNYEALFTDQFYISWTRAYMEGRKYLMKNDLEMIGEYERVLQLVKNELN